MNCTENRARGHMLSNNDLCLHPAVQYVLLFLVLAVNSDRFSDFTELHALTQATCSYALLSMMKRTHLPTEVFIIITDCFSPVRT